VIDPKGGKFRVAHDCGAFGLKLRFAADWAAPRSDARPGERANLRHIREEKP